MPHSYIAIVGCVASFVPLHDAPGGNKGNTGDDGEVGGATWLTQAAFVNFDSKNDMASPDDLLAAALAGKTIVTTPAASTGATVSVAPTAGDASSDTCGLNWLSAAAIGGQRARRPSAAGAAMRRRSLSTSKNPGAPTVGVGWLTSGKLGVSTEDGSDDEGGSTIAAVGAAGIKGKNKNSSASKGKKQKDDQSTSTNSVSATPGAPGGWLAAAISSGTLGVVGDDGIEEEVGQDGSDGDGPAMITTETQWDEGGGEAVAKAAESKLPPWAKKWTPPPADPAPPVVEEQPITAAAEAKPTASGLDWIGGAVSGAPTDQGSEIIVEASTRDEAIRSRDSL